MKKKEQNSQNVLEMYFVVKESIVFVLLWYSHIFLLNFFIPLIVEIKMSIFCALKNISVFWVRYEKCIWYRFKWSTNIT